MIKYLYINFYWFVYIFSYIVRYMVVKQKKLKIMKSISVCYAIMLVICVVMGSIFALTWTLESWWRVLCPFLFVFPFAWMLIPFAELRKKIPEFPDFSTVLFVLSFAVLVVITTAVTLLMTFKSFLSIMCIFAVWLALLMTVGFICLIPKRTTHSAEGNQSNG